MYYPTITIIFHLSEIYIYIQACICICRSVPMLGAWCSRVRDVRQYLRIDLQSVTNITGISSQGLKFSGNNWVSSYTVSYSCDGRLWIPYVIGGQPMVSSLKPWSHKIT